MKRQLLVLLAGLLSLAPPLGGQGAKSRSAARPAQAAPQSGADPVAGKQIYKSKCAICHFDTSTAERVGPGMKGLFQAEKLARSGLAPSEENLRKLILEGSGTMQPFRGVLTRRQLDDLLAYLKTL